MKSAENNYKLLGVTPQSTIEDIKSSYRRLAKKYHPDINPSGKTVFVEITAAYDWLLINHGKVKINPTITKSPSQPQAAPETKPPPTQNWTPDLRYQFFDQRRKRWISNRYLAGTYKSREPDADGYWLLRMPPECFEYNGMIEYGNQRFFFKKDQPDGSIAEIGGLKFKIVYTERRYMF